MDPARWQRIEEIFHAALALEPRERDPFIASACAGDEPMRTEILALLSAAADTDDLAIGAVSREAGGYLESSSEGMRFGSYRAIRRLGQGGMGAVYLAVRDDGQFDKEVAVKLIRAGTAQRASFLRRFLTERQILANLDHPNIARLIDGGVSREGLPYLVMEYVDGDRIDQYASAKGLGVSQRLRLFLGICEAVQHAHRHMVIHRDLKPSNVMVNRAGCVKLLDFGIARIETEGRDAAMTATADRAMTPGYASPEMIRGGPVTTAADIFSLGVILYELLTGARPFESASGSAFETEQRIMTADPVRPSEVPAGLVARLGRDRRQDLDAIVSRALSKEPGARYESVEALGADVQRYLDGFPVRARQGTRWRHFRKFVQRHRLGVAAGAILVLTIMGFAAGMAIFASRAARERDAAEAERKRAERVSRFLSSLFESADPRRAQGRDVTARDLLDEGSRRLTVESGLPLPALSQLINTMAQSYQHLGLLEQAEGLYVRHLEIERATNGPRSEGALAALRYLADIERQRGKHIEARAHLAESVQGLRLRHPASPELAHALNNLALVESETGNLAGAIEVAKEAIRIAIAIPAQRTEVLAMRGNLAGMLQEAGEFQSAEAEAREVLAKRTELLGAQHPLRIRSMTRLARILLRNGAYGGADRLVDEALPLARKVWGERHAEYLQLRALALDLSEVRGPRTPGKWKQLAADGVALLGPEHRDSLLWRAKTDSPAECIPVLDAIERSPNTRSAQAARTIEICAETVARAGARPKAIRMAQRAQQIRRALGQSNHPDYARAVALERSPGALRRAVEIERRAFIRPHLQLAEHLIALGEFKEGEAMRRTALLRVIE